ncbi:MAG: sulfur carrier protein ThiS [Nitrospirota bacterium]
MRITLNGKTEEIQEVHLSGLLQSKNIEPRMVSVEINETLIDRSAYDQTTLKDGDLIEFLYFMGGGTAPQRGEADGALPLVGLKK